MSFAIRHAEVIDGTGRPRFAADVLVADGTIAALMPPGSARADDIVDAPGLVLCPGFIDAHSHDDLLVLQSPVPHPKLSQGVCTVVTGNCGISLAPLLTDHPPAPLDLLGSSAERFACFADYLARLDAERPSVNVAPLIGHTSLRVRHVADLSRPASAHETATMRAEVQQALDAGAFGLSTGVYYPPARAAGIEELLAVCGALKGRDAVLAMHIRDEGDHIDAALKEALQVGAASGARLVLSHHKVVGPRNHGRTRETLRMIEAAARLQPVCFDCYPYEAASTMLDAERAARVGDVLITWSTPHPEHSGRKLRDIAADWSVDLKAAAQRLVPGGAIYFSMAAEDVERVLAHPLCMVGSDGLPHDRHPHPRLWGSFPRVLGHYSRERGLMTLETAVHKMTGWPAQRFGLVGRGTIAAGQAADLVLLDAARVRDTASYDEPQAAAAGIEAVWVNGRLALRNGEITDSHAGVRLRPARSLAAGA
ncbi:N-acyl-D-amino-acid deacylase family protein [Ideonella sp. BN130291]|uniref:N-acyl-D-amino-acid deacylase family protein n=1 Tax=Ideonella sp. BN130291 TaxID=3112940 RepID=UPI002E257CC2|nr:D-aminoacylase [Ideonella sp. BN130291]